MPDKFGFNHLLNWGALTFKCIEENCDAGGDPWVWTEEKREQHHLEHHPTGITTTSEEKQGIVFNGNLRRMICRTCNQPFFQERKRGRPRLTCDNCAKE